MANHLTYNFTKQHFAEGSAAATPDTGEVVLYAKTDGLLYSKDDAGTETLVSGGTAAAGGGITSGTANPVSPSTNDLFYRTDLGLFIYYDGTQWVTTTQYRGVIPTFQNTISANQTGGRMAGPAPSGYAWKIERFEWTAYVITTNSGTQYWTCTLEKFDGATGATAIGSALSTQNLAADQYHALSTTSVAGVQASTVEELQFSLTKVSTAGNLIVASPAVLFRLVIP